MKLRFVYMFSVTPGLPYIYVCLMFSANVGFKQQVVWSKTKETKELLTLSSNALQAIKLTEATATFVCKDSHLYSVVENKGFKRLNKVLEPNYRM